MPPLEFAVRPAPGGSAPGRRRRRCARRSSVACASTTSSTRDFAGLVAQDGEPQTFLGQIERVPERRHLAGRDVGLQVKRIQVGEQLALREAEIDAAPAAVAVRPASPCCASRPSSTPERSSSPTTELPRLFWPNSLCSAYWLALHAVEVVHRKSRQVARARALDAEGLLGDGGLRGANIGVVVPRQGLDFGKRGQRL